MALISDMPEQTTQVSTDKILMQTVGGVTKYVKATNNKLVGFNDFNIIWSPVNSSGATKPNFSTFRGSLSAAAFAGTGGTVMDLHGCVHINHEIVFGSAISFHVHWSHIIGAPTGNVVWQIDYSVAKAFGVQAFPAPTTITLTQAAGTQYYHHVIEGSDIVNSDIEPDSVIMVRFYRDPGHASDTFANDAYFVNLDIHVSVDGMATNEKARPFTKV